ncbi:hypothetical protein GTR02_05075 [Kineococcus sp. R8]|uniref:hypothetical protein n=1 Tax=Kineococcus siccus TaxID=2696567 RepID=UPI001411D470|nr:hypothetical protein [Kineococcus siccus]NAZ81183.1 hypothetical protein [Kineococcus siccus]
MVTASRPSAPRRDPLSALLVAPPVLGAVATLVTSASLTSWDLVTDGVGAVLFALAFVGWSMLPFAAAVAVGRSVHRYWRGGSPVAFVGGVVLVALTVWVLWDIVTSESSTAVIGLLFVPFAQAAVAGLTMAGAVGVATLRRRGASGADTTAEPDS